VNELESEVWRGQMATIGSHLAAMASWPHAVEQKLASPMQILPAVKDGVVRTPSLWQIMVEDLCGDVRYPCVGGASLSPCEGGDGYRDDPSARRG
jgi:hypothetical protein